MCSVDRRPAPVGPGAGRSAASHDSETGHAEKPVAGSVKKFGKSGAGAQTAVAGLASTKRIGCPLAEATANPPSRMTIRPRTTVAIGQPVTRLPAKGDQPARDASQSSSMTRSAARSTMVKSAS